MFFSVNITKRRKYIGEGEDESVAVAINMAIYKKTLINDLIGTVLVKRS